LVRGRAPQIDLEKLERELSDFLREVLHGDYFVRCVPEGSRRLVDIAISGDGEPTSAAEFGEVVALIGRVKSRLSLPVDLPVRLITNGSLVSREEVQRGLALLGQMGGEIWFKIDGGSRAAFERINDVSLDPQAVVRHLRIAAGLCDTWVQTCVFALDGEPPSERDLDEYVALLQAAGVEPLKGVLLYGVARQSHQPEAARISALDAAQMTHIAERIGRAGLVVRVSC
jgi:wyosine [tRNA(Phe)-imidazoG37] synthetase (radical SAM superfamily)